MEKRKMRLTIRNKMIGIGGMALLGLFVLFGVNYWAGGVVTSTQELSQVRNNQLLLIHEIDLAQHELMLAAMDSIIDRNDGTISPERMEEINAADKFLSDNVSSIHELADTSAEQAAAKAFEEEYNHLSKGIKQDLSALIVDYGVNYTKIEADFDHMDDLIDEQGEKTEDGLAVIEKEIMQRLDRSATEELAMQDELVMGTEIELKNLILAAMDSIIDRNDGVVSDERMAMINASIGAIEKNKSELRQIAQTYGLSSSFDQFLAGFNGLKQSISTDLPVLIEKGAKELARLDAAFEEIDDRLDEESTDLAGSLAIIEDSVREEVIEANSELASTMKMSSNIGLMVFLVTLVALLGTLVVVTRSILKPLNEAVEVSRRLAVGDLDMDIQVSSNDETGDLLRSMREMVV
jgi:methyl-accepting chemotaxis protein